MKTLIISFTLFFFSISLTAQKPDFTFNDEGIIHYQEVVEVPGKTAEQLYNDARIWFATSFKDAKEVIQYENKENKTIIGKGTLKPYQGKHESGYANFTIKIETKENKYRYTISNIIYSNTKLSFIDFTIEEMYEYKGSKMYIKIYERIMSSIDMELKYFTESIRKKIPIKNTQKDW